MGKNMQLKLYISMFFTIFKGPRAAKLIRKYFLTEMPNHSIFAECENYYDPIAIQIIFRTTESGIEKQDHEIHRETMDIVGQIALIDLLNQKKYRFLNWLWTRINSPYDRKTLYDIYRMSKLVKIEKKD